MRRIAGLVVLMLLIVVGVGALARADKVDLNGISRTLGNVRARSADAALETKVRSALLLSRRTSGMKVDVAAKAGAVTLAGRVPSQEARTTVEGIVGDVPGVASVQSGLIVDATASASAYEQTLLARISDLEAQVAMQERLRAAEPDGEQLARKVEFELFQTGAFDLGRIRVHSDAGKVSLEGMVRSEAERLLAVRLTRDVSGVKSVANDLVLTSEAAAGPKG